jgi:hypothetical protein
MLGIITNLLGGWQVKLTILVIVLISLFVWHRVEVNKAVTQATNELKLEYSKEVFRQIEIAKDESIKLKKEKEKADAEYKKNLASANARYESLHRWLSNLPKHHSASDNPGNPGDAESRPKDIVGKLSRADGENLAQYGLTTETLRQGLLSCYRQYDTVKEKLDKLRLQNSSKTD